MDEQNVTYDPGDADQVDVEEWSAAHTGKRPPRGRRLRIRVDKERFTVTEPKLTGGEILALVGKEPDQWRLVQRLRGGEHRDIGPDDIVDLRAPGVERFKTKMRFAVCIEGAIHAWHKDTITTEEIASLGGWDASVGVIEVNEEGDERTLASGEVVQVRPGLAFGKKLCWKRG